MRDEDRQGEQGFMLLGVIVAIFLILLALSVAAPKVARELRREREIETVHRGDQYVRAIQLYYRKTGHYPGSIEQLEKTNNVRFLRKRYLDPLTNKDDWRIIHVGEQKTTVKGFFGKPLGGIASAGLGSMAGSASTGGGFGPPATGSSPTNSGPGGLSSGNSFSLGGSSRPGGLGSSSSMGGGIGSQSASEFKGGGGPIMGVGLSKNGSSIIDLNEQTTYQTWEFIYDPRIEQMKAKSSLFGGGMTSSSASSLGSLSDSNSKSGNNSSSQPQRSNPSPQSPF
ncbi:MAG TPA: type II secretion system protein [Edaphobacter sp.]|nr:type II secretion system protein [Edaphobacter sp.]